MRILIYTDFKYMKFLEIIIKLWTDVYPPEDSSKFDDPVTVWIVMTRSIIWDTLCFSQFFCLSSKTLEKYVWRVFSCPHGSEQKYFGVFLAVRMEVNENIFEGFTTTNEQKLKKTKRVSNDRSRHDDQNEYRIIKIGAILEGQTSVQSFMICCMIFHVFKIRIY